MKVLKCKKCGRVIGELDENTCITNLKKKCPICGHLNKYRLRKNVMSNYSSIYDNLKRAVELE